MAEWTSNAVQTVNPNEEIVFLENPVPCNRGLVWEREGTGLFELKGYTPFTRRCMCHPEPSAVYEVDFGANIAIPTGETVSPISLAITLGGATIPASTMIVTPAAVEEYFNVSRAINALVRKGCCETLTVRNTSTIPILVQNANIIFDRPDLAVTR
jgi:hypothetical protein